MRNNSVNYFGFGKEVQEMSLKTFLIQALEALLLGGAEQLVQYW